MIDIEYQPPAVPDTWVVYQRYYALGLAGVAEHFNVRHPALRLIPGIDNKLVALSTAGRILQRISAGNGMGSLVGRYVAEIDGRTVKFAIDPRDSHPILDPDLLAWSDVFFKANRWPQLEYDPKLVPIVNGNGLIGRSQIQLLKQLREHPKDIDLAFVSALRGGIEHNVRLFEELATLDCRKELIAIFPPGFDAETRARLGGRLQKAGVQIGEHMPAEALWQTLGRSRVVVIRSGHHLCIPWRMIDLLCMGACIAFDAPPIPQWPEPLVPGRHYFDCATLDRSNPDDPVASYEQLRPRLEELLGDPTRIESFAQEAAGYFDHHASPDRVAEYVLRTISATATG